MAQGIVYPTQAELEEKVKEKIFPNRRKGIKGAAHQQAVLDMIASLWREGSDSCCDITSFTATDQNSTINVTREIIGSTIKFIGRVTTNTADQTEISFPLISDIIPQNFRDSNWLRATRLFVCHNKSYGAGDRGNNGYIFINQLSSYGRLTTDTPDTTNLFVPGVDKGSGRSYSTDVFKNSALNLEEDTVDPNNTTYFLNKNPALNIIDTPGGSTQETSNYLFNSPMDLTEQGLSIGYKTSAYVAANEDPSVFISNTPFVDFSFIIEMEVL